MGRGTVWAAGPHEPPQTFSSELIMNTRTVSLRRTDQRPFMALLAGLILLALLTVRPTLVRAQDQVGTKYFECLDEAEIRDGICYLEADGYLDKVVCNIEYLENIVGCAAWATSKLTPIVSGFTK